MRFRVYSYYLPDQMFRDPRPFNKIPDGEWEILFTNSKNDMTSTYVLLAFVKDNLISAQGWETGCPLREGYDYRLSPHCIEAFRKVALQLPGPDQDFEIQFP